MRHFLEQDAIEQLVLSANSTFRVETLGHASHKNLKFSLHGFTIGSTLPDAPTFGLVGGVHGLERIGTQVVLSFLESLVQRLKWDETLHRDLENIRLCFVPLVNPVGMYFENRCNGNGVDLMRNAPIEAENAAFLLGGHRISKHLPWFRGFEGAPMELENQVLCDFIRRQSFDSKVSVWLDVHSGYGIRDRLWFPYAKSINPFPHLAEVNALKQMIDLSHPNHVYQIEPQALEYSTHGDLWDFLYDEFHSQVNRNPGSVFLPMTLEMGSWLWIRKNPFQLFSFLGPFNPVKPHRKKRTLRRHLVLFDILMRATLSHSKWVSLSQEERKMLNENAHMLWYRWH